MSILDYPKMLFKELFVNTKETVLNFPEVGWTITIPKGFDIQPLNKLEAMNTQSFAILESLTGNTVNYPGKTKFCAIYQLQNVFSADFTDLNEFSEGLWQRQMDGLHNTTLNALYASYKDFAHVNITTAADARQKGNITFNTFEIIVTSMHRELDRLRYFSTVYKNYGIHIGMAFTEPVVGERMLDALRSSTFS